MKVQEFTGGLANKQRPQFIGINQGAVYTNIDNTKGSLLPVKDKLATELDLGKYSYYHEKTGSWINKNELTDYAELNNVVYFSNRTTALKRYDGSEENAGIQLPNISGFGSTTETLPELPTPTRS